MAIAVEASTAFSMGGVPDPIFSRPNIKEKIAVWLRETTLRVLLLLSFRAGAFVSIKI